MGDLLEGIGAIFVCPSLTLAITFVLLFVYTRCLRATIAPLACSVIVQLSWQLGLLELLGSQRLFRSWCRSILAVGVSHGVQVIKRDRILQMAGRQRRPALPPGWLSGLYIARDDCIDQ